MAEAKVLKHEGIQARLCRRTEFGKYSIYKTSPTTPRRNLRGIYQYRPHEIDRYECYAPLG